MLQRAGSTKTVIQNCQVLNKEKAETLPFWMKTANMYNAWKEKLHTIAMYVQVPHVAIGFNY